MKILIILSAFFFLNSGTKSCGNKKEQLDSGCYKGRLEVKGGCMNYTISLRGGDLDTSLIVREWPDESTGKTYKNVFALGTRCSFPERLNEGDEFYFRIDSNPKQDCSVCLMYYPVPQKRLNIKVLDQPCTQP